MMVMCVWYRFYWHEPVIYAGQPKHMLIRPFYHPTCVPCINRKKDQKVFRMFFKKYYWCYSSNTYTCKAMGLSYYESN